MRRLQCNQVSFILAGIVLQIIASELYHGADCLALKKLKIHGIVEPLLNSFKSDSDGSSFFNIDESILSSLSEKAVEFLGSFVKTSGDKVDKGGNGKKCEEPALKATTLESPKEGIFTVSHKENSTEVDCEEDNKLFFNSENDPVPHEEEENIESSPQQECDGDGRTDSEYSDSIIISLLQGLKVRFNIPINFVQPKPSEKRQYAVADYDYYEPFT